MTLERIFRALDIIGPRDKLIRVNSWLPAIYRYNGKLEVSWPALLVDCISYRAMTMPVWDRTRFRELFRKGWRCLRAA